MQLETSGGNITENESLVALILTIRDSQIFYRWHLLCKQIEIHELDCLKKLSLAPSRFLVTHKFLSLTPFLKTNWLRFTNKTA